MLQQDLQLLLETLFDETFNLSTCKNVTFKVGTVTNSLRLK